MTVRRPPLPGWAAGSGFLLIPLTVLVYAGAALLATVLAPVILVPPGCGLADMFSTRCSLVANHISMFFTLLLVPGVALFFWQALLRRTRTAPLDRAVFPAACAVVDRVLASAAPERPISVVLGPRLGRRAYTGGTGRRPYIALGPELLATAGRQDGREVFEAILRHELAHVQNKDLLRAQGATGLRISTRVAAVTGTLAMLAGLNWPGPPPGALTTLGVIGRALVVAVAAELAVRAFFRIREHEADLRAAAAEPARVRSALAGEMEPARGPLGRLGSRHPAVAVRRAGLDDVTAMTRFPLGQVLAGGVFFGVALSSVQALINLLRLNGVFDLPRRSAVDWPGLLPVALFVGVPAAAFLAIGVWREAAGTALPGRRSRPWAIGALFGAGLIVGSHLAPYLPLLGQPDLGIRVTAVTVVILCAGSAALCAWLVALLAPEPYGAEGRGGMSRSPLGFAVPVAVPVAVAVAGGFVVLTWQVAQLARTDVFLCPTLSCGVVEREWSVLRLALGSFALPNPWPAIVFCLAVLGLFVAALLGSALLRSTPLVAAPLGTAAGEVATDRRALALALRRATVVAGAVAVVTLTVMHLPVREAFAGNLLVLPLVESGRTTVPVLGIVVAGLVTALLLPIRSAGPVAAMAALAVGLVTLAARLPQVTALPADLRRELVPYYLGVFLGEAQVLACLAIFACLLVRRRVKRRPPPRPTAPDGSGQSIRAG